MAVAVALRQTPPERILCARVPHLRIVVERMREPELLSRPVLIYGGVARPTVVEASRDAMRTGVQEGMLLSRALSLCPQAAPVKADEPAYEQASRQVLAPMLSLTPDVEPGSTGTGFMVLRGLERLVGDEQKVAEHIAGQLKVLRFPARAGIAGSRFAAEMAARASRDRPLVVPTGAEPKLLERFPIDVLPALDSEWRELKRRLTLLGLKRLGQVAALGRIPMQAQFGKVGVQAWLMASGQPEQLKVAPPPTIVAVHRQFEPPLDVANHVDEALSLLVDDMARQLRWHGLYCAAVEVSYQSEHLRPATITVVLKEPTAAAPGIRPLVATHLLPRIEGPVIELGLRAHKLAKLAGKQLSLFEGRLKDERLSRLAQVLEARMGSPMLYHVEWLASSHLEEDRFALTRA